jgi:hypothetical protein
VADSLFSMVIMPFKVFLEPCMIPSPSHMSV